MFDCSVCGKHVFFSDMYMLVGTRCMKDLSTHMSTDSPAEMQMNIILMENKYAPKFFHESCLRETAGEKYAP